MCISSQLIERYKGATNCYKQQCKYKWRFRARHPSVGGGLSNVQYGKKCHHCSPGNLPYTYSALLIHTNKHTIPAGDIILSLKVLVHVLQAELLNEKLLAESTVSADSNDVIADNP